MKKTILVAILLISNFSFSQESKKEKTRQFFSYMFCPEGEMGLYIGITQGLEKLNYSIGGEGKLYASYYNYPILSGSIYLNYRNLLLKDKYQMPEHSIGIGAHFSIIGLEASVLFEKSKNPIWRITPKLGFDWGNISLFYGYDINLNSENKRAFLNHNIQLKYSIFIPFSNN